MDERRIDLTTTASARRAPLPASIPRPAKRTMFEQIEEAAGAATQ